LETGAISQDGGLVGPARRVEKYRRRRRRRGCSCCVVGDRQSAVAAGTRPLRLGSSSAVTRASLPSIYRARRIDISRSAPRRCTSRVRSRDEMPSADHGRRRDNPVLLFFGSANNTRSATARFPSLRPVRVVDCQLK